MSVRADVADMDRARRNSDKLFNAINPPPESYVDRRLRELEERIRVLERTCLPNTQYMFFARKDAVQYIRDPVYRSVADEEPSEVQE